MKRLVASILFVIILLANNSVFASKNILETKTVNGLKYTNYIEKEDNIDNYIIEVTGGNEDEIWRSQEDQKLDAFLACRNIINKAEEFSTVTQNKYDSKKWTKVILDRPQDEKDNWSNSCIECFAKKDAVIQVFCKKDDHSAKRGVSYICVSDPEMVNDFIGDKVYGLDAESFFNKYGGKLGFEQLHQVCFSFTLLEADNGFTVYFHFDKSNKLQGFSADLERDFNEIPYFEDFKYFVSPKIPEGLLTKGVCLGDNVNVREIPLNGSLKTKANKNDIIYIKEFKKFDNKETWVNVVTPTGIDGWINGKYVAPEAHCFNAHSRLRATFDYLCDLPLRLGKAISVKDERYRGSYMLNCQKWDGVELQQIFDSGVEEEEEVEADTEALDENEEKDDGEDDEEDDEEDKDDEEVSDEGEGDGVGVYNEGNVDYTLIEIKITKPVVDFIGFKVGSNLEDLKKLSNKLLDAGWHKGNEEALKNDGVYTWYDQKGSYTQGIKIVMKKGKATSISLLGPDLAN